MTDDLWWLDGPGLAAWVEERGWKVPRDYDGTIGRIIRHWRGGRAASVNAADRVVTFFGSHLTEIPDELWMRRPQNPGRAGHAPDIREQVMADLAQGRRWEWISRRYGISPGTIARYKRAA